MLSSCMHHLTLLQLGELESLRCGLMESCFAGIADCVTHSGVLASQRMMTLKSRQWNCGVCSSIESGYFIKEIIGWSSRQLSFFVVDGYGWLLCTALYDIGGLRECYFHAWLLGYWWTSFLTCYFFLSNFDSLTTHSDTTTQKHTHSFRSVALTFNLQSGIHWQLKDRVLQWLDLN